MRLFKAFQSFFNTLQGKEPVSNKLDVLAYLQKKSRLVDFFQEDITSYSDEEVGSAIRQIHEETKKALSEKFVIETVLQEKEGARITLHSGYDPQAIKIVGKVKEAPYHGVVIHRGWKSGQEILQPAEVEVK